MTIRHATPDNLKTVVEAAAPGDIIELSAGQYGALHLWRIKGRKDQPITIRGDANSVFEGGQRFEDFRREANSIAKRVQAEGGYPSLGREGYRGFIRLLNCAHVRLTGFRIRGAWPSGISLNNCIEIEIDGLDIAEGTFGIFADGPKTQGLTIRDCTFVQDIERGRIWREIDWNLIHGHEYPKNPVDLEKDARAFDGEFFRSFGIGGDVTIANNLIEHAFNGIHMFHSDHDGLNRYENRDVRIFGNMFRYIRDNAIEPEWGAQNWWIYQNRIFNCHKWYSLEVERSGHFYIFGNTGYFDELPGPGDDENTGGAVFKLDKSHIGTEGMHYVFNNSYYVRSAYIKKNRLQNLVHFNNAISYCMPENHADGICYLRGFFGGPLGDSDPDPSTFTTDWAAHNIRFFNDVIDHVEVPETLCNRGYEIEFKKSENPGFTDGPGGDFQLVTNAAAKGHGVAHVLQLVDGSVWSLAAGMDVGAWQGDDLIPAPDRIPKIGNGPEWIV